MGARNCTHCKKKLLPGHDIPPGMSRLDFKALVKNQCPDCGHTGESSGKCKKGIRDHTTAEACTRVGCEWVPGKWYKRKHYNHLCLTENDDTSFKLSNLRKRLTEGVPSGVTVIVALDCCHSGEMMKVKYELNIDTTDKWKDLCRYKTRSENNEPAIVAFTACTKIESSIDTGSSGSVFTKEFVKIAGNNDVFHAFGKCKSDCRRNRWDEKKVVVDGKVVRCLDQTQFGVDWRGESNRKRIKMTPGCETNERSLDLRKITMRELFSGICDANGDIKERYTTRGSSRRPILGKRNSASGDRQGKRKRRKAIVSWRCKTCDEMNRQVNFNDTCDKCGATAA